MTDFALGRQDRITHGSQYFITPRRIAQLKAK